MSDLFSYASRGTDTTKGTTLMDYTYHPLSETYPLMGEDDLAALAASIKAIGQQESIWLLGAQILDGRNRYLACKIAGVKAKTEQYVGNKDQASLVAFIEAKNERRRHLTQEWLRLKRGERIERVTEARKEGKSLRAIAEKEDVSVAQVQRDLDAASSGVPGGTVEPEGGKVTGKDGKIRTAKPKREPKVVATTPTPAREDGASVVAAYDEAATVPGGTVEPEDIEDEADAPEKPVPCDSIGVPLSEKAAVAFDGLPALRRLCKAFDAARKDLEALADHPVLAHAHMPSIKAHLENAKKTLWAGRPQHVCPYCGGAGVSCRSCRNFGFVTGAAYDQAPEELRKAQEGKRL